MGFSLFSSSTKSSKTKAAYIFDIQGQLQRLNLPITVAEMMLEAPGSIVCSVDDLRMSRVIRTLRADEQLHASKFYIMFSAKKANSKVPQSDFEHIMFSAKKANSKVPQSDFEHIKVACRKKGKKGSSFGTKVVPFGSEEEKEEGVSGNLFGDDLCITGFPGCRSSSSKKWRPVLQPIFETK